MNRVAALVLLTACAAAAAQAGEPIYYRTGEDGVIVLTNVPDRRDLRTFLGRERLYGAHSGAEFRELISRTALQHGVHPDLVYRVVEAESNFNPDAVSPKGAQGLMQLMPATAVRFGVNDPFDPVENVTGGVRYLRYLLDRFKGNYRLALAAYNAGETAVLAAKGIPPYRETRNYVAKIMRRFGPDRTPYARSGPAAGPPPGSVSDRPR